MARLCDATAVCLGSSSWTGVIRAGIALWKGPLSGSDRGAAVKGSLSRVVERYVDREQRVG